MSFRFGRLAAQGSGGMIAALLVAAAPAHMPVASIGAPPASRIALAAQKQHMSVAPSVKMESADFDPLGIHRYP